MASIKFNRSAKKPKVYHLALSKKELEIIYSALDHKIDCVARSINDVSCDIENFRKNLELDYLINIKKSITYRKGV